VNRKMLRALRGS